MPLHPQQINSASLQRQWRGYHRGQVDSLLARIGRDYAGAIDRIADLADQAAARADTDAKAPADGNENSGVTAGAGGPRVSESPRDPAEVAAERAGSAAEMIIANAEAVAAALIGQACSLRDLAQRDADTARQRLEDADSRARRLESEAWDRREAARTRSGPDHPPWSIDRVAERIRHLDATVGALRTWSALQDQISQVDRQLAALGEHALSDSADDTT